MAIPANQLWKTTIYFIYLNGDFIVSLGAQVKLNAPKIIPKSWAIEGTVHSRMMLVFRTKAIYFSPNAISNLKLFYWVLPSLWDSWAWVFRMKSGTLCYSHGQTTKWLHKATIKYLFLHGHFFPFSLQENSQINDCVLRNVLGNSPSSPSGLSESQIFQFWL